jgi:hypothetical protein
VTLPALLQSISLRGGEREKLHGEFKEGGVKPPLQRKKPQGEPIAKSAQDGQMALDLR